MLPSLAEDQQIETYEDLPATSTTKTGANPLDNPVQLHLYKLRTDRFRFEQQNQDWLQEDCEQQVLELSNDESVLSPEHIRLTLKYFVQCGSRLRQMTANFDDPEATFCLLKEKEKDLELAATVGLRLLKTNDELRASIDQLNEQLSKSHEVINQLQYNVKIKEKIIRGLNEDQDYGGGGGMDEDRRNYSDPCVRADDSFARIQEWTDKIKRLEQENEKLKKEASLLHGQTKQVEDKEKRLMKTCVHKMAKTSTKLESANMQIAKRAEECNRYKQEIRDLLSHISDLNAEMKILEDENSALKDKFEESLSDYNNLEAQMRDLQANYKESLQFLDESREEAKKWRRLCSPQSEPTIEIVPSMPPSPTSKPCEDEDDIDSSLKRRSRRPRRTFHSNFARNRDDSLKAQLELTNEINQRLKKPSNPALDRSTDSGVQSDAESLLNHESSSSSIEINFKNDHMPRKKVILTKPAGNSIVLDQWKQLNLSQRKPGVVNGISNRFGFAKRQCPSKNCEIREK